MKASLATPQSKHHQRVAIRIVIGLLLAVTFVGLLSALSAAEAGDDFTPGTWQQPYGGCKEGWQAPRSEGARQCRDHGWTVRHDLVVSPRGIIRYDNMRTCKFEDGSGQRSACIWHGQVDGNGRGLTYWFGRHNSHISDPNAHYVWWGSPLRERGPRWHFATKFERHWFRVTNRKCIVKRTGKDSLVQMCPSNPRAYL